MGFSTVAIHGGCCDLRPFLYSIFFGKIARSCGKELQHPLRKLSSCSRSQKHPKVDLGK